MNSKIKIIIIFVAAVALIAGVIFGGIKLSKLFGSGDGEADLQQKREEELLALDKQLEQALIADSDLDGLTDEKEKELGTNPDKPDTDGDGILDKTEIETWKTDPLKPDTDGDGHVDGYEVRRGYNPLGPGKIIYPRQ